MIHTDAEALVVGSLLNSNSINAIPCAEEGHNLCVFASDYCVKEGAVQVRDDKGYGNLTDLVWGTTERHALSTHESGRIILWDVKKVNARNDGHMTPTALVTIQEEMPVTRCLFLPHTQSAKKQIDAQTAAVATYTPCFLTASEKNTVVTLWSAFTVDGLEPSKLQVFGLQNPASSYLIDVCYGQAPASGSPPSALVMMGDRTAGKLFAWHLRASWGEAPSSANVSDGRVAVLQGCDYVVPFHCKYPTYSWEVRTEAAADISDEQLSDQDGLIFDVKIHAYQSAAVQRLTLTSMMLLPSEHTWVDPTPGVRIERLWPDAHSTHVSEIGSEDGLEFDEEYDVGDDEDLGDEFEDAPEPSALPIPAGLVSSTQPMPAPAPAVSTNVFSNWLGSLVAKSPSTANEPVAPPPVVADVPPLTEPAMLSSAMEPTNLREATPITTNRSDKPGSGKKGRKKSPKPGLPPMQILQRPVAADAPDVPPPVAPPATALPAASAPPANAPLTADIGKNIAEEVRRAVREEINATVIPAVKVAVQESLQQSIIRPIQASIAELSNQGIQVDNDKIAASLSQSVDVPLRAAFAGNMKTTLLPALESMVGQVFQQVSDRLDEANDSGSNNKDLEAISTQLTTMTGLVARLTKEFQALRQTVALKQEIPAPRTSPEQSVEETRNIILDQCSKGHYEAAFKTAISKADANFTLFCCENCNLNDVFGGDTPKVNQVILLCIMQHLSQIIRIAADDSPEIEIALQWLQEIALSLNPPAMEIQDHLRGVLEDLVRNISSKMRPGDHSRRNRDFIRVLQIVRGIQF